MEKQGKIHKLIMHSSTKSSFKKKMTKDCFGLCFRDVFSKTELL